MGKRIVWIDQLKGFAIFLVVFGHICIGRMVPLMDTAQRWIYGFHMPLFMFVSGMLLTKISKIDTLSAGMSLLKQKAVRLFPPLLFWGVLNCVLHRTDLMTDFFLRGGAYYWYLWVLFLFVCILAAAEMISVCCGKYKMPVFIGILCLMFAVIQLTPEDTITGGILGMSYMHYNFHYFCLGYLYSLYRNAISQSAITQRVTGGGKFRISLGKLELRHF